MNNEERMHKLTNGSDTAIWAHDEIVSLRGQLAKAQEPLSVIVSSYGDGWYDGFIKAKEINQHSDYNEIGDCDYNGSVILRMSEYAESEYAKILIIKGRLD
jgi:hypothetical protein